MNNSAEYNAGYALGSVLAPIILAGIVLAIGIYFGNRLARKRNDGIFVRWPVGVALGVILFGALAQCSQPAATNQVSGSQ